MTTHTLTGVATDPMAATATDTTTINSTSTAPNRVVRRSLLANRTNWGSAVDATVRGPSFSDDTTDPFTDVGRPAFTNAPPDPLTVGIAFTVEIPCRFTGCRVYKAPNAVNASGVPFAIWSSASGASTTGTLLGSQTTAAWAVDAGGWRQVTFATPVDLVPGVRYTVGYLAVDGIYAYSQWVFNGQDTCVWPFLTRIIQEASSVILEGTSASGYNVSSPTTIAYPPHPHASNYYVDVQIEWDDPLPGYSGGTAYWDQWTTPYSRHAFPVAVFFCDPEHITDYYNLGVNTLIGGPMRQDYIDAHNADGNRMDWWPAIAGGGVDAQNVLQAQTENAGIASQVVGYHLDDEPDMSFPYRSPDLIRTWLNYVRQRDSTKPIYVGFGIWAVRNQGFAWSPQGASALTVNQLWRQWADMADIVSCDDYTQSAPGNYGTWAYAAQVARMREITDDAKPVWITIETTWPNGATAVGVPTPDSVRKTVWATLIAGARGVVFFDHRFASDFVSQNFNAMIGDAAMSAMVTALSAQLQTLAVALHAPDLGLVTAYTSSNTTAGPRGGTFGVPMHYTTRADSSHHYLFAQAIRPGATTATFTVPAWAGNTLTVIGESRTVTVSGGGVITDTFAADYTFHLYQRTP